jgi:methyltransferase (TIGR00027 family)
MSTIGHVTDTAFWVATYRAREGERADALFHDPLAAKLADGRGRAMAAEVPGGEMVGWSVVLRTCIIDELVLGAIAESCDCVLNLGAGLDTRPYRMALPPQLLWIEADFPSTIDYKNELLAGEQPRCRLERKKADLSNPDVRAKLFADVAARAQKILVITEGLVPYLSNDEVAALADDLHAEPRFFGWIMESVGLRSTPIRRLLMRARRRHLKNAPMRFQPGNWAAFFADRGWQAKQVRYFAVEAERRRRPAPLSFWMRAALRLAPPGMRERMRRSFGYALLTRT